MNVIQLSFFIIPLLGILFIPNAFTQEFSVPDWIKNNAGWWASEAIDDNTFVHSMQWLITNDIIVIPPTIIIEKSETTIPNWVKNNAGWWADDLISDSDFVNGIQYLIKIGIIVIPQIEKMETTKSSDYPEWLINNPSWQTARELTNSPFNSFDTDYFSEELFPCNHCVVNINSHGFRGSEFSKDKPDNTYRIFAVGGSTTHGATLVNNDETWPAYLQHKFNQIESEISVDVINAGIMATTTEIQSKLIKDISVNYEPNLIIMYGGWNDLTHLTVNETIQNWQSVCELGNVAGFNTIIILQPLVGTGNRVFTDHEYQNLNVENLEKLHLLAEKLVHLNQHCTQTVDFRSIFDYVQHPIFLDDGHTESLGNQIIAENVFAVSFPIVSTEINPSHEIKTKFPVNYYTSNPNQFTIYAVGGDFTGRNFDGLNLENAIFDRADLSNTSFNDAKLSGARLVLSNLAGTDLSGIDFSNSNLAGTDLSKNDLTNTVLRGTNLSNSNLSGQDLSDNDLTDTILRGVNLSNANLGNLDFSGRDLTGANLSGQDLSDNDLTDTILRGVNLSNANLGNLDFSGRDLTGANLSGQDLSDKDLTDTLLSGADLTNVILPDVDLSGKDFAHAKFIEVDLSGKDLSESDFSHSELDNTNLENSNLTSSLFIDIDFTKIKNKSLVGSYLSFTSFAYSNLSKVNLTGAVLESDNFSHATLNDQDFTVVSNARIEGGIFLDADLLNSNFEGVNLFVDRTYTIYDKDIPEFIKNISDPPNRFIIGKQIVDNEQQLIFTFFTNFNGANLQNVNFSNADLRLSTFIDADLTNTNLSGADLRRVDFTGANLMDAVLDNTILDEAVLNCINHPICEND